VTIARFLGSRVVLGLSIVCQIMHSNINMETILRNINEKFVCSFQWTVSQRNVFSFPLRKKQFLAVMSCKNETVAAKLRLRSNSALSVWSR